MSNVFEKALTFIYRNARPLDLARFQYHFENGDKNAVLTALAAYQNEDGGFGHALEPDAWNPNSSPIQTWAAVEILREIGVTDRQHNIIQGILRYLDSSQDFKNGVWQNTVPTNNDYPHASWWNWSKDTVCYNPTANLCGFIIKYADKKSNLFSKGVAVAKDAVDHFIKTDEVDYGHLTLCYLRLMQFCEEAGETGFFNMAALSDRISANIKVILGNSQMDWCCDGISLEFIKTYKNKLHLADLAEAVCNYLTRNQQDDGSWNIPWSWDDYPEEWAVSKNWWKAYGVIGALLYLKEQAAPAGFSRVRHI